MSEWAVLSTPTEVTREMVKDFVSRQGGEWQDLGEGHEQGTIARYNGRVWIWGDPSVEWESWDATEWRELVERVVAEVRSQIGIQIGTGSWSEGNKKLLPEIAEALLREWGGLLEGPDGLFERLGVLTSIPY